MFPADSQAPEDQTIMSGVQDPPRFISQPAKLGGEILQRVFFIGLPGHCFVCARKGHLAAAYTRRRVSPKQRQQAIT